MRPPAIEGGSAAGPAEVDLIATGPADDIGPPLMGRCRHDDWETVSGADGKRRCRACDREWTRRHRKGGGGRSRAPHPVLRDRAWMDDAACRETDPDLWFPAKGAPSNQARRICAVCPVAAQCLVYACALRVETGMLYGMWAGRSGERDITLPFALATLAVAW